MISESCWEVLRNQQSPELMVPSKNPPSFSPPSPLSSTADLSPPIPFTPPPVPPNAVSSSRISTSASSSSFPSRISAPSCRAGDLGEPILSGMRVCDDSVDFEIPFGCSIDFSSAPFGVVVICAVVVGIAGIEGVTGGRTVDRAAPGSSHSNQFPLSLTKLPFISNNGVSDIVSLIIPRSVLRFLIRLKDEMRGIGIQPASSICSTFLVSCCTGMAREGRRRERGKDVLWTVKTYPDRDSQN